MNPSILEDPFKEDEEKKLDSHDEDEHNSSEDEETKH